MDRKAATGENGENDGGMDMRYNSERE